MPKGMKVKFLRNFEGEGVNRITPRRLYEGYQKGVTEISQKSLMSKLKLTGLVVRDVELTKRKYSHPNATAFTHNTTTVIIITTSATKTQATTLYSTANTTYTAIKAKDITVKNLGYIETKQN